MDGSSFRNVFSFMRVLDATFSIFANIKDMKSKSDVHLELMHLYLHFYLGFYNRDRTSKKVHVWVFLLFLNYVSINST